MLQLRRWFHHGWGIAHFCATYGNVLGICDDFFQVTDLGDGGPASGIGGPPWVGQGFTFGEGYIALAVSDSFAGEMDERIGMTAADGGSRADGDSLDGGPCVECLENLQACANAVYDEAVSPNCTGDGG